MKNTKAVWFLPFRYPALADLEAYFERMALEGWHRPKIRQVDSIRMVFSRGEPQTVRYVADFQPFPRREYAPNYTSFGWEPAGRMANVFLWRMPYEGARPEAFTDAQSLRRRNDTLSGTMLAMIAALMVFLVVMGAVFALTGGWKAPDGVAGFGIAAGCIAALMAVLAVARRVVRKNRGR